MTNRLKKICTIEGCDEKHRAKGFCVSHYAQQRYQANRERLLGQVKAYQAANPEKVRESERRYRKTEKGKAARNRIMTNAYDNPGFLRDKEVPTGECSYMGAHKRVMYHFGRADGWQCICGQPAEQWAWTREVNEYTRYELRIDWNGEKRSMPYSLNAFDYVALCRSCHIALDRNGASIGQLVSA